MLINTTLGLLREIKGYDENQLRNAKVSMDNMFYVVFTKPHDESTSENDKNKDDKNIDPCFMPS